VETIPAGESESFPAGHVVPGWIGTIVGCHPGVKFRALVEVFEKLEGLSSRNAIRDTLASFLRTVPKSDLPAVAYLCLGRIGAEYQKIDLGLAEKMLIKALAGTSGRAEAEVAGLARQTGDLGLAAAKIVHGGNGLAVRRVIETLRKIAETSGQGSQSKKLDLMSSLLAAASAEEAKYLLRIALGNLKLGVASPKAAIYTP